MQHTVEIHRPPSAVFKKLLDANNISRWAPVVTSTSCSDEYLKEGTPFRINADLKPVGGPKFEFDNIVAKLVDDKEIVWRQTKGTMKRLEWHFMLESLDSGTTGL